MRYVSLSTVFVRLVITYHPADVDCHTLEALQVTVSAAKRSCEHLRITLQTLTTSWALWSRFEVFVVTFPNNFSGHSLQHYLKVNHDFRYLIS